MNWAEERAAQYEQEYGDIPKDYTERLAWMVDKYKLSSKQMENIIEKKNNMIANTVAYDYKVVLYEIPGVKSRPKYRFVNRKNYMDVAKNASSFIHVYSPHARDYHESMHRLIGEELEQLHIFIQTPCTVVMNCYEQTPKTFNITDTFLAEYGLILNISHNDYDNMMKLQSDRLNATAWLDDSLVVSGTVNKYYSILPRVEILIRYLNCVTSMYQYKRVTSRNDYNKDYPIQYLDAKGELKP